MNQFIWKDLPFHTYLFHAWKLRFSVFFSRMTFNRQERSNEIIGLHLLDFRVCYSSMCKLLFFPVIYNDISFNFPQITKCEYGFPSQEINHLKPIWIHSALLLSCHNVINIVSSSEIFEKYLPMSLKSIKNRIVVCVLSRLVLAHCSIDVGYMITTIAV